MKIKSLIMGCLSALISPLALAQINVTYNITPQSAQSPISPLIYGFNWTATSNFTTGQNYSLVRMGGNRATAYNWENNASNAGTDWNNSSDNFWCDILGISSTSTQAAVPGIAATTFIDQAKSNNGQALISLPMAGYVSADKNGNVTTAAPGSRWCQSIPAKGSAFSLTPDLTDGKVYTDEFVNFLKSKYGAGGVKYCLDNEPDLWYNTHPLIHPSLTGCQELVDKTTATAKAVKAVDANAEIFGLVSFGMGGFLNLANANDWNSVKGNYSWYIDYFLDKMKGASTTAGTRLVDVLDLHWYPEATGDQRIINTSANSNNDKLARLQAPRTLWDAGYVENSWIGQSFSTFLPILPRIQSSISTYNAGTKLAITEFQYGGFEDITGAIALSDVLGVFGKYGVYAATHWDNPGTYGSLAYKIYRNYDGNKSTYGDTNVGATMSDKVNSSVYASTSSNGDLHIIAINKSMTTAISGAFNISGGTTNYTTASVYAVNDGTTTITKKSDITISGNTFTYSLPALSVYHFIFKAGAVVPVTSVTVLPVSASIVIGGTTTLVPTVLPSNATNKNVTWSSSNTSVATVSAAGVVTGIAAGTATITVTTVDQAKTATAAITVTTVPVTGVTVAPISASIGIGGTTTLVPTVSPSNATNKNVTWSSSNTSVATVSAAGVVTGIAAGNATITVTTVDQAKTATASITVGGTVPVTGVTILPISASITVGGTTTLTPTVLPSNATNKNATWSSSNTSIATVSATGVVTGIAIGNATITVTTVDQAKTATASITVTPNVITPCSNPVAITIPFKFDGAGEYCWSTTQTIAYVNSWNMTLVEINGVDFTNKWSNSMPAAINGAWYIHYKGSFAWSHFEAPATKSVNEEAVAVENLFVYPNPVKDHVNIVIPDAKGAKSALKVFDNTGRLIKSISVEGETYILDMAGFNHGMYNIVVYSNGKVLKNSVIKE